MALGNQVPFTPYPVVKARTSNAIPKDCDQAVSTLEDKEAQSTIVILYLVEKKQLGVSSG
jgi:hypothetical protein